MFKFFVILGALYGVFVLAHETQKSWVVNFKTDIEISGENFDAVENWIVANKGVVVDKLKSNDYKVILAQMDNNIHEIIKDDNLGKFIESIDDDDDYDHEDL